MPWPRTAPRSSWSRIFPPTGSGLFWRFLVEDDPDVDIYLVRDADSVINVKERWAVADWLNSGKAFHVMRDNPQHSELMLAGMWGAHRGNIGGMRKRIEAASRPARTSATTSRSTSISCATRSGRSPATA